LVGTFCSACALINTGCDKPEKGKDSKKGSSSPSGSSPSSKSVDYSKKSCNGLAKEMDKAYNKGATPAMVNWANNCLKDTLKVPNGKDKPCGQMMAYLNAANADAEQKTESVNKLDLNTAQFCYGEIQVADLANQGTIKPDANVESTPRSGSSSPKTTPAKGVDCDETLSKKIIDHGNKIAAAVSKNEKYPEDVEYVRAIDRCLKQPFNMEDNMGICEEVIVTPDIFKSMKSISTSFIPNIHNCAGMAKQAALIMETKSQ